MSQKRAADEEESFPRGKPEDGEEKHQKTAEGAPKKKHKKKTGKGAGKGGSDDEQADFGAPATVASEVNYVARLRHGSLVEGSLICAAVRDVSEEELTLNLPYQLVGYVAKAQAVDETRFSKTEAWPKLPQLYAVGQLVVAVVTAVLDVKGKGHSISRIELSLRPQFANAGIDAESLVPNMFLPVVVQDEQEHVLTLDFCIAGLKGTIKKSELAESPVKVCPGAIIRVAVASIQAASGTVRCSLKQEKALSRESMKLECVKAGFLVSARVEKVIRSSEDAEVDNHGLVTTFCGSLLGTIHNHYQRPDSGSVVERKNIITCRVLAVVPGARVQVHLAILPHLLDWSSQGQALPACGAIGQRFDGQASDCMPKYGLRVKLPVAEEAAKKGTLTTVMGFCPLSRMADKDAPKTEKQVAPGDDVECRVLGYNFLDSAMVLTRRASDLKEGSLVSVSELTCGQGVTGKIVRLTDFGAFVQLSEYVTGLCHLRQLTDVPLAQVSKKYQVDQMIKCRVLRIFPDRRQVHLTAKKSLLKDSFQFNSFEQVRMNMLVTGYVANVQAYGGIVQFYGDTFGLLPPKEMESDGAPALGMVVKVKISGINGKAKKFALTMNTSGGKTPEEAGAEDVSTGGVFGRQKKAQKKKPGPHPGELASEFRAMLCTEEGVFVRFKIKAASEEQPASTGDTVLKGFIPTAHLSDDIEDAKAKYASLVKKLGGVRAWPSPEDKEIEDDTKGKPMKLDGVVLSRRYNPKRSETEEENKDLLFVALLSQKPSMHDSASGGHFVKNFDTLEEGKRYAGYVKDVRAFGVLVSIGSWRLMGLVPKARIAEKYVEKPEDEVQVGQSVQVKIHELDTERRRFTGDLRPEGCAEVAGASSKEVGDLVALEVTKVRGTVVHCTAPGVTGHLHAAQLVEAGGGTKLSAKTEGKFKRPTESKKPGDVVEAKILSARTEKTAKGKKVWHLELTARPSLMKAGVDKSAIEEATVSWKTLQKGTWVTGVVAEVQKGVLWLEVSDKVRGRVVPMDTALDLKKMQALTTRFKVGDVLEARVIQVKKTKGAKQLDLSLLEEAPAAEKTGKDGKQVLPARHMQNMEVAGKGIVASYKLSGQQQGYLHITEIVDPWVEHPLKQIKKWQTSEVAVVGSVPDADGKSTLKGLELSLRASQVHDKTEDATERRIMAASELEKGQTVNGYVVYSGAKGVFVALSWKFVARIKLKYLGDTMLLREDVPKLFPPGKLIKDAKVIEVDVENNRVELSLREGRMDALTLEQLSAGDVVSGRIKAVVKYGFFMRLDGSEVDGLVHANDISDSASVSLASYKVGDRVRRAKVTELKEGKLWLGIKDSLFADEADADMADGGSSDEELMEEPPKEKGKKRKVAEEAEASGDKAAVEAKAAAAPAEAASAEEEEEAAQPAKKTKKAKKAEAAPEPAAAKDSDDEAPWDRAAAVTGAGAGAPDMASFVFSEFKANVAESSSEEEGGEEEDDEEKAEAKLTKRQKKAQKVVASQELQQLEAENADGRRNNDPRSVEDFERLVLTQGDTSIIWIRYVAFHLKMSDLEKARQVAERAVKHIGYSEAQERFNAWVMFMNLECTFGTDETAQAVFKRAVAHNDAKQAHLQYAKIQERNKKPELAVKAYELAARKFPQSKTVWLDFMALLYTQEDLEGARKVLPKALAAVPKVKHPIIVSKAAILEYTLGSIERGRSIFEGLLDSYPKRTDLWSVYLDAHIKAHTPPKASAPDLKEIRGLLERCCALTLKPIKMRFFFKRWLDFEKKWGDEESEEMVRGKARAFVETQGS